MNKWDNINLSLKISLLNVVEYRIGIALAKGSEGAALAIDGASLYFEAEELAMQMGTIFDKITGNYSPNNKPPKLSDMVMGDNSANVKNLISLTSTGLLFGSIYRHDKVFKI